MVFAFVSVLIWKHRLSAFVWTVHSKVSHLALAFLLGR